MKMKNNNILLIYPKSEVDYDLKISSKRPSFSKRVLSLINYLSKVKNFESINGHLVPPLGLVNIASVTPANWQIDIIDERINPIGNQQFLELSSKYKIIGLTSFTANVNRAYLLADEFRRYGSTVVIGGYHASLLQDEALLHCDTVINGFAELSWLDFLKDFEENNLKKVYKRKENQYINPDWKFINKEHYLSTKFIEVSRGCHNKCDFCCINSFNNGLSYRNIDEVISSIEEHNGHLVILVSDNLTSNKAYCKELFSKIIAKNINVNIVANISHDFAYDEELVQLAARAGLKSALIGFETLDVSNKEELYKNKKIRADYKRCIDTMHKYKIGITGCFIVGFDGDSEKTVNNILKFASKNKLECLRISPLIPYPGTPIYNKLEKENRIQHNHWEEYHAYGKLPIYQSEMEFLKIRNHILSSLKKYYSLPNIFIRLLLGLNFKSYYIPYSLSQWYKHNISLKEENTKANRVDGPG